MNSSHWGRFTSAAIVRRIDRVRLMDVYSLINIVLVAGAMLHPGWDGA